jgi:RNA polymerase sigma-70 factor (ECF subfamily)
LTEEQNLILQAQTGDNQAYGVLVQKYMKRAYFIALGLVGSHENALDLSQEAFVRAYRSLKKIDVERKFFTWLYQILRNLCFNFLRDSARHAAPFSEIGEQSLNQLIDDSQNTWREMERHELHEVMWQAINELKPNEREIIILKDFQDMSYKKIAEFLACPIGTVMSRIFNARKALKTKLEDYYHE